MKTYEDFLPEPKTINMPMEIKVVITDIPLAKWLRDKSLLHGVSKDRLITEIIRATVINEESET